ncbi:MAG: PAS domain S-box protein [Phycisphaerales bacterium]
MSDGEETTVDPTSRRKEQGVRSSSAKPASNKNGEEPPNGHALAAERRAVRAELLYQATTLAAATGSIDEALRGCLEIVCELTGWPIGHAYTRNGDPDRLHPTGIWAGAVDDPRWRAFIDATRKTPLASGVGLPGRILEQGEPAWIRDIRRDPNFVRREVQDLGDVRSGFGFPIKVDGQIEAVLEFFSTDEQAPDHELLRLVGVVGEQLGRVLERRRAEHTVREMKNRLQDFVEHAPVSMHWVGPDGKILWANEMELRLLGYKREEYIGRHIAEFHVDQEVIDDILARLGRNEELHEYEARLRAKNGAIKHVLIDSNVSWRGDEFVHTRCFTRDITAQKLAERTLGSEYAMRRAIESSVPAGIAMTDLDGRQTYVNPAFCAMLGFTREELEGATPPFEYWPADNLDQITAALRRTLEGDAPAGGFELEFQRKDGTRVETLVKTAPVMDETGANIGWLACVSDITALRRAESRRLEEERRYRRLLHSVRDAVFVYPIGEDGVPGRFLEVNETACERLGYARDEILELSIRDITPHTDEDFRSLVSELLASGEMQRDSVHRTKTGELIPVEVSISTTTIEGRRHVISVARDLRPRLRAEREAVREAKLRHAITENATAALFMMDAQGYCTFMNPAAEEMIGYTLDEISDQPLHNYIHHTRPDGSAFPIEECPIDRALPEHLEVRDHEDLFFRRNGEAFPVLCSARPVIDESGDAATVIEVRDITERKLAEEAIRESERRFREVVSAVPAAIYTCDQEGRVTLFNEASVKLWGREPVIGKDLWCGSWKIYSPNGEPMPLDTCPMAVALREGRRIRDAEIVVERPDGTRRQVLANPEPLYDAHGRQVGAINMLLDVTERNLAIEALRRSEEQMRAMLQTLPVGVWLINEEGRIILGNPAGERIWEGAEYVPTDEFHVYKAWRPGEDDPLPAEEWAGYRAIHHGETTIEETLEIECFDGSRKIILNSAVPIRDDDGSVRGAVVVNEDITDRKKAEYALRESEQRFRMMANSAPVMVWLSSPDQSLNWVNREWLEFRGRSLDDELGSGWLGGLHPDDRASVHGVFDRAFEVREPFEIEYRIRDRSGEYRWVLNRGVPMHDADDEFTGFIGGAIDIHDRKRAERALQAMARSGAALGGSLDYTETMRRVADALVPAVADWCVVDLLDPAEGSLRRATVMHSDPEKVRFAEELTERYPPDPSSEVGVYEVLRTGRPQVIEHFDEPTLRVATNDDQHYRIVRELGIESAIFAPLVAHGRKLGVLTLVTEVNRSPLSDADLPFIEEIARRCALAIDNAQLYQESQHEVAERKLAQHIVDAQRDILERILAGDPIESTLASLVEIIDEAGGDDVRGSILLFDAETRRLLDGAGPRLDPAYREAINGIPTGPEVGTCGRAAHFNRAFTTEDIQTDSCWAPFRELADRHGLRACWSTPISTAGGEVLGTFAIYFTQPRRPTVDEQRILNALNRTAAIAIERRQAAQRLEFQAKLLENLTESVVATDIDGRVTYWGRGAEALFGFTEEEAVGRRIETLIVTEEEEEEERDRMQEVIERGEWTGEYMLRRKNGEAFWSHTVISLVTNERGEPIGFIGIDRDISERRDWEEALREKTETLGTINQVSRSLVGQLELDKLVQTLTDAATDLSNAQFGAFFYNVIDREGERYTLYTISGVDPDKFRSFPMPRNTQLFGPTFRGEGVIRLDNVLEDPRFGKNDPYFGMPQGHLPVRSYLAVPVISRTGEVHGGLFFGHEEAGVFTEQTEQIIAGIAAQAAVAIDNARLYQQLRENELRFRTLAETIPDIVFVANRNLEWIYVNPRFEFVTGRSNGESHGAEWVSAVVEEDGERVRDCLEEALAGGAACEQELRLRTRDGSARWFVLRGTPIHGESNQVERWFGTLTDIHDLKIAEQKVVERARQQAAVASLGQRALLELDLQFLFDEAVSVVRSTLGVEYCKVLELMPSGEEVFLRSGVGWRPGLVGQASVPTDLDSQAGYTLRSSAPVIVDDLRQETRFSGPQLLRDHGVISGISCIIPSEGRRPWGVLGAHSTSRRQFTNDDVSFLQAVANVLGSAIHSHQTRSALRESEERLTMAMKAGRMGAWEWDIRTNEIRWSSTLEEIHGLEPGSFGGTFADFQADMHPDDRDRVLKTIRRSVDERTDYHIEYRMIRPDGRLGWLEARGRLLLDKDGEPLRMAGVCADVTERKQAERALRMSEARFRSTFENAAVGIGHCDLNGRWLRVNERLCEITEYSRRELLRNSFQDITHPDDVDEDISNTHRLISGELPHYSMRKRYVRKSGDPVWVNLTVSLVRKDNGDPDYYIAIVEDIEAQKRAEETRELLLAELSHRVKNTLATVQSIASKTMRQSDSMKTFRGAFEGRLSSLALAHTLLTRSNWEGAELRELVAQALRPYAPEGSVYELDGDPIVLPPRIAMTLSMVFHELTTNAAKYGALSTSEGRVHVRWRLEENEAGDGHQLRILWRETNGPEVREPERNGFGSHLIRRGLAYDLEATSDIRYEPEGVECEMVIPWKDSPAADRPE